MGDKSLEYDFFESIKNGKIKDTCSFSETVNDLDLTCSELTDALKIASERGHFETIKSVLILIVNKTLEKGVISSETIKSIVLVIKNAGVEADKNAVVRLADESQIIFDNYYKKKPFLSLGKILNPQMGKTGDPKTAKVVVDPDVIPLLEAMVKKLEKI